MLLLSIIIFNISILLSQEIPQEFNLIKNYKLSLDSGENWGNHTTIGSIRWQDTSLIAFGNDSLNTYYRFGIINNIDINNNDNIILYNYGHFSFKRYFYLYLYPRVVSDVERIPRYSGMAREISRGGFNSGETDIAGIGFQNDWLIIQFGRGRKIWGSGDQIELVLSENSFSYDLGSLDINIGNLRGSYFHGFLETIDDNQRYITGRGIEWTNKKNMILSLSECVIYSGKNRGIDFSYLNPVSTHLEIELNNRQNKLGTDSGNAAWQLSLDFISNNNIRFSGNLIIDELVLDQIQLDSAKVHGLAWSSRIAWTPKYEKYILSLFGSWIKVGTHTFRHEVGNNNFVHRNNPLGWEYGSDGEELKFGINYGNKKGILTNLNVGVRKIGAGSLIHNYYVPYENYKKGPFPSRPLNKVTFSNFKIQYSFKRNIFLFLETDYFKSIIEEENFLCKFGMNIFLDNFLDI